MSSCFFFALAISVPAYFGSSSATSTTAFAKSVLRCSSVTPSVFPYCRANQFECLVAVHPFEDQSVLLGYGLRQLEVFGCRLIPLILCIPCRSFRAVGCGFSPTPGSFGNCRADSAASSLALNWPIRTFLPMISVVSPILDITAPIALAR